MTATAGVTYLYDGNGKRVQKSNGTLYWYGMGADPLAESDAAGNIVYRHYYFNGMRVARREPNNWVDHYMLDHLGNARVIYGNNGGWDQSDYYPFGGERVISSAAGNRYKFTGKERDLESGLDNFGARYDSSSLGRFMSVDPVSAINFQQMRNNRAQDQFLSVLVNPQSWNAYAYSLNNPLRFVDPTGEVVRTPEEINKEIEKRKLEEQRAALANYGKELAQQVKDGQLSSKEFDQQVLSESSRLDQRRGQCGRPLGKCTACGCRCRTGHPLRQP